LVLQVFVQESEKMSQFYYKENAVFFNNTFETLGVTLQYLECIIGLKNAYIYSE